jgi:DNA-binding MarR family transcriptional regulator
MDQGKLDLLIKRYEEVYFMSTRKIFALISNALTEVTTDQYFVLRYMNAHGASTSSELADHFDVNRSAITAMIDRLVSKGFVKRLQSEEDRRVVQLDVTQEGRGIVDKGEEQIRSFVESFLFKLEEKEMEQFIQTYEKIAQWLKTDMKE